MTKVYMFKEYNEYNAYNLPDDLTTEREPYQLISIVE